jgi:hypothetical protein
MLAAVGRSGKMVRNETEIKGEVMAEIVERRKGNRRKGPIRSETDRRLKTPPPAGSTRSGNERRRAERRKGDRRKS